MQSLGAPHAHWDRARDSVWSFLFVFLSLSRLSVFSFGRKWDSDTLSKLLLGALARLGGNLGGQRSAKP